MKKSHIIPLSKENCSFYLTVLHVKLSLIYVSYGTLIFSRLRGIRQIDKMIRVCMYVCSMDIKLNSFRFFPSILFLLTKKPFKI